MEGHVIHLSEAFASFQEHWRPRVAGYVSGCVIKIAKFQDEFVWHRHEETEEMFLVHRGKMEIRFRDRVVALGPGDLFIVPRGTEHITAAAEECEVLVVEAAGTRNTGNIRDTEKTAELEPEL